MVNSVPELLGELERVTATGERRVVGRDSRVLGRAGVGEDEELDGGAGGLGVGSGVGEGGGSGLGSGGFTPLVFAAS